MTIVKQIAAAMIFSAAIVSFTPVSASAAYRIPSGVNTYPTTPITPGKIAAQRVIANDTEWAYLAYVPPAYDSTASKRWPFLLFLQVAGAMYNDGWSNQNMSTMYDSGSQGRNGGPIYDLANPSSCKYISDRFIVVSPYLSTGMVNSNNGKPQVLMGLIKHLRTKLKIDTTCSSVMGYCAGGGMAYTLAARYPREFSGVVTMSCNDNWMSTVSLALACSLKTMPYRIYADRRDPMVPAAAQQAIYDAVHNCPGTKVTITWTDVGQHEIWQAAGLDTVKSMYDWMIANGGQTSIAPKSDVGLSSALKVNNQLDGPFDMIGLDGRTIQGSSKFNHPSGVLLIKNSSGIVRRTVVSE